MVSEKLLDLMDKAIAMEMQVSIQYMWQHIQWGGIDHYSVHKQFKKIAIQEMIHAEEIAERLFYLGKKPTTQPSEINVGNSLKEMIQNDERAEKETIDLYKSIISLAQKEKDSTTEFLFKKILRDEEDHHDFFVSLSEDWV